MTNDSRHMSSKDYDDLAERIDDNADLILQNQRILKNLQHYNRIKQFFRIINIIIIVTIAFGAFKFLSPYVEKVSTAIDVLQDQFQSISDTSQVARDGVSQALDKLNP